MVVTHVLAMTQTLAMNQEKVATYLLVVSSLLGADGGYLYDQHAPSPLPWAASARGRLS
jgi:hypothetical protein